MVLRAPTCTATRSTLLSQWPIKASENYSHYFCNHRVAELDLEGFLEQDCASEKVELPLMTVIQAAGQKDNLLDHPLSLEWGRFVTIPLFTTFYHFFATLLSRIYLEL